MSGDRADDWVLVTGAPGFVGAALVHELLLRGYHVLCLVRAATPAEARRRVVDALHGWTRGGESLLESGRLAAVRADLHIPGCGVGGELCSALRGHVTALVHAAGETRFTTNSAGEPALTNVTGTRHVLDLAATLDCHDWHYISTAYVAGAARDALETHASAAPQFHNDYERSKWQAEQLAAAKAGAAGATLNVYRPSIVVGHSASGWTTHFAGIYYMFRATSLLARAAAQHRDVDRHALPLRIPAAPDKRPNLVCIDDLARAFGELFATRAARGGVYHLTHPDPPTNARIKDALERYYDIGGGRFDEHAPTADPTRDATTATFQKIFDEMTAPLREYLFDAPHFSRVQVARFVKQPPAPWTDERLRMLIDAAETGGWRAAGFERQLSADVDALGTYFREFLPPRLAGTPLGQLRQLDLTVRFELGTRPERWWWCHFRGGRLEEAAAARDRSAEVTYRTSESRFWAAAAGEISAAELFLSGQAEVAGDIERALKFAMVLQEFVREHPYRRPDLPVSRAARARPSSTL